MSLFRLIGTRARLAALACACATTLLACGATEDNAGEESLSAIPVPSTWQLESNGTDPALGGEAEGNALEDSEVSESSGAVSLPPSDAAVLSDRAEFGVSLGPADGLPVAEPVIAPLTLSLPTIGVINASIISVGVAPDGAMEVPPAEDVGWYRYGPAPGDEGSTVLAAHIAAEGRDGVFRNLDQLQRGDVFEVANEAGEVQEWRVVGLGKFEKEALPFDEIFNRTGMPRMVLITCGGEFNPSLRSYDSNVVAFAEPVV